MIKFLMSFLALFIFSGSVSADVYKYTAADGSVHYTDTPPNKKYKRIIRTKIIVRVRNKKPKNLSSGSMNLVSIKGAKRGKYYKKSKMSRSSKVNKQKYAHYIAAAARKYNVDVNLVHAVIRAESAYNSGAVSPVGAGGLMQLMPATARRFGVTNRYDPKQSIDGGTHYLQWLLKKFKGNIRLAVAGYNAGEGAVMKYNYTIPPYKETQNYVKKVMSYYGR